MKRKLTLLTLIVILTLVMVLAACSKEAPENLVRGVESREEAAGSEEMEEETLEYTREDIMKDFREILDSKNNPTIINKFIDENIDKVEKEDAREMIIGLEDVLIEYTDLYTDEIFAEGYQGELLSLWEETADFDSPTSLFLDIGKVVDKVENENLKEMLDRLPYEKFKLINMEGSFYPIIDYEAIKEYNKYLDDEMKSYINIKSFDSNKPAVLDAALFIDYDELVDRLIGLEEHITTFSEGIRGEELLRLYGSYFRLYLGGVDNSPIYEYETEKIRKEVLASYREMDKIDNSITAAIVGKYRRGIEDNDHIIDSSILSKITEYHNEAIARLEESK